jgi:hypothetical protein
MVIIFIYLYFFADHRAIVFLYINNLQICALEMLLRFKGIFCHEIACDIFLDFEFDDSGRLSTKIYDKRDDFNFKIINFPYMCSNIPASPAYGVNISQSIRYARASSNYSDFLKRHLYLRNRLLDQGYIFRYQDLVCRRWWTMDFHIVKMYKDKDLVYMV